MKWRHAFAAIVLLVAGTTAATAAAPAPLHIDADGQRRDYLLVTPDAMPPGPRPLVILLHGHLGTAANALGAGRSPSPLSEWLEIAEREEILVVALQGLRGADHRTGWNDCRSDATDNPEADDVAFASAVVGQLVAAGRVDPTRVYVMGMSNGAIMSLRLALEMQPAPAAIAVVAGAMAKQSQCRDARRPVSVLLIHGTDDPLVPYQGGEVGLGAKRDRGSVQSVEATRDYWLRIDGLQQARAVESVIKHVGGETGPARRITWGADAGPQVQVITVDKGGHVEPSAKFRYPALYYRIVGAQSRDFEAAEEAWAFFRNKRAP